MRKISIKAGAVALALTTVVGLGTSVAAPPAQAAAKCVNGDVRSQTTTGIRKKGGKKVLAWITKEYKCKDGKWVLVETTRGDYGEVP